MGIHISRRIKFCAGHRLVGHGGKCERLHGHNYVAEFTVTSDHVDTVGRVIDFAELKARFKGWLDDNWDHGFVLFSEDREAIAALQSVQPNRVYLMPYNPTAENMARFLAEEICPELLKGTGVSLTQVTIWETEESAATFTVCQTGEDSASASGSERRADSPA